MKNVSDRRRTRRSVSVRGGDPVLATPINKEQRVLGQGATPVTRHQSVSCVLRVSKLDIVDCRDQESVGELVSCRSSSPNRFPVAGANTCSIINLGLISEDQID
jgi:hypothetical protein